MAVTQTLTTTPRFSAADAGTYTGFFSPTNNADVHSAGLLSLSVGASSMCSGKIYCGGVVYPILPARMDVSGRLRAQSDSALCVVDVQLDLVGGKMITGTVSGGDWVAPVVCQRSLFSQLRPTSFAGRYDVILSDGSSSADAPLGKAFLSVTVANNGNVTLAGALADNTLLTQQPTVRLNEDGSWPFYSSAQKTDAQGQAYSETVMGWVRLTAGGVDGTVVSGDVLWTCNDPTNSFSVALQAVGQSYSMMNPPAFWPAREQVHIYLLMGQSNMAGHGRITAIDKVPNLRVISFGADNFWQPGIDPLHKNHGVGPGLTFGKMMADKNPGVVIALIPVAVDSTSVSHWLRGTKLYENAVARAQLAMRWGTFKGFIWHQGENDALTSVALNYKTKLAQMIADIRADLGVPNAPFVVGEIPRFIYHRTEFGYASAVNKRLDGIPEIVPLTGCVSSEGLTSVPDGIHFDGPSQHKMGQGYAEIMSSLEAQ
ncbi:MAG: sialate O-acetylesterase [Limisphaerales bacterium]